MMCLAGAMVAGDRLLSVLRYVCVCVCLVACNRILSFITTCLKVNNDEFIHSHDEPNKDESFRKKNTFSVSAAFSFVFTHLLVVLAAAPCRTYSLMPWEFQFALHTMYVMCTNEFDPSFKFHFVFHLLSFSYSRFERCTA